MAEDLSTRGQAVLDASLARAIRPATFAIGLGYLASAAVHFTFGGLHEGGLPPLEFASAILLFVLATRHAQSPRSRTAILVAVILVNNLVFHSIHDAAAHTPVLYLLALGAGVIAGIPRLDYALILAGSFLVQGLSIAFSSDPFAAWAEPVVTLVSASVLSVTLRYHAREHLAQISTLEAQNASNRAAREAAFTHFLDLAEGASDLICELDARGRFVYANPAHETLFGIDPKALIGVDAFEVLDEVFRRHDSPDLQTLLAGPAGPIELEIPTSLTGQERVVIEAKSRPFDSATGRQHIVVTARDVTRRVDKAAQDERHRQALEAEVASRTQALTASVIELQRRERLASVGTLAAGIAHQINNPVGGILLSSELALKEFEQESTDADGLADALRVNIEEARRCGDIVKHLLRFARNEPSERRLVDLGPTITRVADLCRPYAASRDGVVQVEVEAPEAVISANPVEIEESLINLIRNALESRDAGATVHIGLRAGPDQAEILVTDDGPGISEQDLRHVFDPFYTTRLREGGTGLGLSVARDIAIDHGGALEIESDGTNGTQIRVTLPLAPAPA